MCQHFAGNDSHRALPTAATRAASEGVIKDVVYKLDRAIVTIMTKITEESMVDLVGLIDRLSTQYFYSRIELRISSPGGTPQALDYYLDAISRFRKNGVEIQTRALTHAMSAGAAILSLGDGTRKAESTSLLLYHFVQYSSDQHLTARTAKELHRALSQMDRGMTWRMALRAFQGYGMGGEPDECARSRQRSLESFSETDWRIMSQLAGKKFRKRSTLDEKARKKCLAAVRKRVAENCEQHKDPSGFFRLYQDLFDIDAVMTGALACELRLIDRLVDDRETPASAEEPDLGANTVPIPEWHTLFPPGGHLERSALCRHVMIFGETGSGKTQSGILPVLRAILRQADGSRTGNTPVSCALVIDPKKEILPILQSGAPNGVSVKVLKTRNESKAGLKLNLMMGEWSIDEDLDANDMLRAAQRILLRCASFIPRNPAFQTLLGRGGSDNAYWKNQGVRLAQTIIGVLLLLLKYRDIIFDPERLNPMAPYMKAQLRDFGAVAGFLAPEVKEAEKAYSALVKALDSFAVERKEKDRQARARKERHPTERRTKPKRFLLSARERQKLMSGWTDFATRICAGQEQNAVLREHVEEMRKKFVERLKSPGTCQYTDDAEGLKAAAESCWDAACIPLPEESVRPTRNLITLAGIFQRRFFLAGSGKDTDEEDQLITRDGKRTSLWGDEVRPKHFFLAHRLIEEHLRELITEGRGINEVFDEVEYFHSISATKNDTQHYTGLFAFAKPAFLDFSDSGPSQALYFGCEPFLTPKRATAHSEEGANLFAKAINSENGGTVYVFQPSLGYGQDTLIARALKAHFFETVLSDKRRQKNGSEMPLVAYVADEFHRFITSDVVHGEQSFFDTCRSFGAFCVVASQSMSSLHHALAGDSFTNKDEKAVEILLNNTGTKLFFRTTDAALHAAIDRLCPVTPGLPKATQVRPPSSLRPGECYAVVTDGRFMRCKIDLNARC